MTFLLQNGADPDMTDQENKTPLHIAAMGSVSESCALLLKYGAKENVVDFTGKTPLAYAIETKHGDCVTLLRLAQLSREQGNTTYAGNTIVGTNESTGSLNLVRYSCRCDNRRENQLR